MDVWEQQKREQQLRDQLQNERNWRAREEQRRRELRDRARQEEEQRRIEKDKEEIRQRELAEAKRRKTREIFVGDSVRPEPDKAYPPEAAVNDSDKGYNAVTFIASAALSIFALQQLGSRIANDTTVWVGGLGIGFVAYVLMHTSRGKKIVHKMMRIAGWGIAIAFCGYIGWLILSALK